MDWGKWNLWIKSLQTEKLLILMQVSRIAEVGDPARYEVPSQSDKGLTCQFYLQNLSLLTGSFLPPDLYNYYHKNPVCFLSGGFSVQDSW